jgi:hypothetical protein
MLTGISVIEREILQEAKYYFKGEKQHYNLLHNAFNVHICSNRIYSTGILLADEYVRILIFVKLCTYSAKDKF